MKTIGIVGSRRRNTGEDFKKLWAEFEKVYADGDRIVSGGCPEGADSFAETIAKDLGITIIIHYAPWKRLGKRAGHYRNTFIADDCTLLIALPAEDRTGGTEDTIDKVMARGKQLILC